MPEGIPLNNYVIDDLVVHYDYEPKVEETDGIYSHAGTIVPWTKHPITLCEAHTASTVTMNTTLTVVYHDQATCEACPKKQPNRDLKGHLTLNSISMYMA
jgi:hypothetical protein